MTIPIDMDGNKLTLGTRVAAADNICGIKIKIGKVVGYTPTRVKIDFEGEVKTSTKAPRTIAKIFNQEE